MPRPLVALALAAALAAGACSIDNEPAIPPSTTAPAPTPAPTTTGPPPTAPPGDPSPVVRILDGDSLLVDVGGAEEEVRLAGINAPEADECLGDAAREALEARLTDRGVVLVPAGDEDRDQFGRLLRYAYAAETSLGEAMLRNGLAIALTTGHPRQDEFRAAEEAARADGIGLWATAPCGDKVPQRAITIPELASDPSGPDEERLEEEWVLIRNDGELPADFTGWVLRDESSANRYPFPDGFTLAPGREVTVRTGCGTDDRANLYWCAGQPVWNNGGDTALLLDQASTVIARFSYGG